MRWVLPLLLILGPAQAESGWRHFESARFGFSVDIPSGFIAQPPPENGDGATFVSPDGTTELKVWGSNLLDQTLKSDSAFRREAETEEGWRITYSPIKKSWYAYSGLKGSRIVYTKAVSACGGSLALYFRIEYPKAEKLQYDAMVTRLSHSLKAGPAAECPAG
jgi:hypothetical protein